MNLEPFLTGPRVTLAPLQLGHRDALLQAASDGELWNLKVTSVPGPATIDEYIRNALAGRAACDAIPFVTEVEGHVVGSTRFWRLDRHNRTVEIGYTWVRASWQRSFVNTEAKFLMLRHAFEEMGCIRVQFVTDELNSKSRMAILRLGAVEEGLLRNERIMPDGRRRNSVFYSIIDTEWAQTKAHLLAKLEDESDALG